VTFHPLLVFNVSQNLRSSGVGKASGKAEDKDNPLRSSSQTGIRNDYTADDTWRLLLHNNTVDIRQSIHSQLTAHNRPCDWSPMKVTNAGRVTLSLNIFRNPRCLWTCLQWFWFNVRSLYMSWYAFSCMRQKFNNN